MAFKMKGFPKMAGTTPIKQKEKGKDVEGSPPDLKYSMEKVQQGPISEAEKRRVREKIIELEDRIEFIVIDVDNDRVDRDKGFKRIRQLEEKVDELRKTL